ncbi:MAG: ribonuclease [Bacteroidia bacterium]|nr:MAG: ribonuclease [Bacteroidia bacterium]
MKKQIVIIVVGLLVAWFVVSKISSAVKKVTIDNAAQTRAQAQTSSKYSQEIDDLTKEEVVVAYIKEHNELPEYYITKREAMRLGWQASKGNLCDVAKNKAIGGDIFTNREKQLPTDKKRKWYEAYLNYHGGIREADRVVFSNDELIFVTFNHYKTFQKR